MPDILISRSDIQERVRELGAAISADYRDRAIDIICLVNGASVFCADLARHITVPARQHFLCFTSYSKASSSGEVRITLDVTEPLEGRHVLVVEGIVVSGRTPSYVMDVLRRRRPASLALCALGKKPRSLAVDLTIDYFAFELGAEVAVGYGVGSGPEKSLPDLVVVPPPVGK